MTGQFWRAIAPCMLAVAIGCITAAAQAQSYEDDETPDAGLPLELGAVNSDVIAADSDVMPETDEPETDVTLETEDAPGPEDADVALDQPLGLWAPLLMPSGSSIDPSRFTRGLPSSAWTGKAGVDNRDVTPHADLRLERWMPGARPGQTAGVAWLNVTAPGLMAWDKTRSKRASIPTSRPGSA